MISLIQRSGYLEDSFVDIKGLINSFVLNVDACQSSKKEYGYKIKLFLEWLSRKYSGNLRMVKRSDILEYKEMLTINGKSQGTICLAVVTVRKFFEWLELEGIFPNISKGIKSPKKSKGFKKDCLTTDQIKEALNSFDLEKIKGMRDYAIFNLMVRTGVRIGEVSEAKVRDLRQVDGQAVLYVKTKGSESKDDYVLLVEDCIKPIRKYLSKRGFYGKVDLDDPLFANMSYHSEGKIMRPIAVGKMIKETLKSINIDDPRITAHSLRHTAISLCIKNGASLVQAQAMSRHADPKTTMIYVHNTERVTKGAEHFVIF